MTAARTAAALLAGDRLSDAVPRLVAAIGPLRAVTGWATVELDRAQAGLDRGQAPLGPALRRPRQPVSADDPPDELLGARCRIIHAANGEVVLLEPSTEGPLAAALARHGEGPIALYLVAGATAVEAARSAGFRLSRAAVGPLGRERRVLVGPRDGPFLLLVDAG